MGMDRLIAETVTLFELPYPFQEFGQTAEQVLQGRIRLAGGQVDDPNGGTYLFDGAMGFRMLSGENIHLDSQVTQGTGQLEDVHVHAP